MLRKKMKHTFNVFGQVEIYLVHINYIFAKCLSIFIVCSDRRLHKEKGFSIKIALENRNF